MEEFLVSLLLSFSAFLGVEKTPPDSSVWKIEKNWIKENETWVFRAQTDVDSIGCSKDDDQLVFPQIIHGIHKIWGGNQLLLQTGDDTFRVTSSFYGRPSLSCKFIKEASVLTWEVRTYSQYFARFQKYPQIGNASVRNHFFDVTINVIAAGGLFILAFFSLFIFTGRTKRINIVCLVAGSICSGVYASLVSGGLMGVSFNMLTAHKIADVCVWISSFCYLYFFRRLKFVDRTAFILFTGSFIVGQILIIFGTTPDIVQLGTTIPIPFGFLCLSSFLFHTLKIAIQTGFNKDNILSIISISMFIYAGANDLFHILGLLDSYMILPLGSVAGVFFLAAAVNQDIEKTYTERNDLLFNLQAKVDEQTQHLSLALEQNKKSQAELIQSARLASLGTLSAGIAHEINNAINFVNGAIIPLERKVLKHIPEADQKIVNSLFDAMKQGTSLTVDIVRSLRNFTGLNQSKVKDVSVKQTVDGVLTILKSKLRNIQVQVLIDENLRITCHQVGLNQMIMNIITNAIDVLPNENAKLDITAFENTEGIIIKIRDNGAGMSPEVQNRIFDPFFTTKEVGKGTGLGLHIVLKEVEKHNGQISVKSSLGAGSEFTITLPKTLSSEQSEAA